MKIEIGKIGKMTQSGSSLIRLIQNNEMPVLDLFVRESVQNSLDAAMHDAECVNVDFRIGSFSRPKLMKHFEGISESVEHRFPYTSYRLLEVKDKNTLGLTGPMHIKEMKDNIYGNLQKLIYQISQSQQQEGAGGSWGLGKTVYYRLGMGLVIYYSRIKLETGAYQSRLAACLVEDENIPDALIPYVDSEPRLGIAWWGQDYGDGTTKPVTDESEIAELLEATGTLPYSGKETGTTVIIPFMRDDLLTTVEPVSENDENGLENNTISTWWSVSESKYITVSLQRWYAPRLSNRNYSHGSWLNASVNGDRITTDRMQPSFQVVQALYNRAVLAGKTFNSTDILNGLDDVFLKEITTRGVFRDSSIAGWISYAKIRADQIGMSPPDNQYSPLVCYFGTEETGEGNPPVVMYTRKPGMIVGYESSGKWTEGIPRTPQNEYIIGIFVPNSGNMLQPLFGEIPLEEYLRKSEKADHASWSDWNQPHGKAPVIARIIRGIKGHITKSFSQKPAVTPAEKNIGLGRFLASVLMPPEGFGNHPGITPPGSGANGGKPIKARGISLKTIGSPSYENEDVTIEYELKFDKKTKSANISLLVAGESGSVEPDRWESQDDIGKPFPLRLKKMTIEKISTGKAGPPRSPKNLFVSENDETCNLDGISIVVTKSKIYRIPYGAEIRADRIGGSTVSGSVTFSAGKEKIMGVLTALS